MTAAVRGAIGSLDPDRPVKVLFTLGSTGVPKGVLATPRMMAANQQQMAQVWPFLSREPPVLLDWLPWSHVFGGTHNLNLVLRFGGTLWIDEGRPMPGAFDRTLANLREVAPTLASTCRAAMRCCCRRWRRMTPWRRWSSAGCASSSAPRRPCPRRSSPAAGAGRASCAASGPGHLRLGPDRNRSGGDQRACRGCRAGQHRHAAARVELKLLPAEGKTEIRVRGPNLFPGYLDDPEATAAAFDAEGFFRSGDAVMWVEPADPNQGLRFDGRLAEDFKLSSGTRINALELRLRALAALGGLVRDVVVVGRTGTRSGCWSSRLSRRRWMRRTGSKCVRRCGR